MLRSSTAGALMSLATHNSFKILVLPLLEVRQSHHMSIFSPYPWHGVYWRRHSEGEGILKAEGSIRMGCEIDKHTPLEDE